VRGDCKRASSNWKQLHCARTFTVGDNKNDAITSSAGACSSKYRTAAIASALDASAEALSLPLCSGKLTVMSTATIRGTLLLPVTFTAASSGSEDGTSETAAIVAVGVPKEGSPLSSTLTASVTLPRNRSASPALLLNADAENAALPELSDEAAAEDCCSCCCCSSRSSK
jgi:hypothetical protein